MGPQRNTPTRSKANYPTTQHQRMLIGERHTIMGDMHPATPVSNSAISSTTSSLSNTILNESASAASTITSSAKTPIDIDSIHEFPMIPSGREEYLKRQGGTDELVKGLDNLHAASESIFKAQKDEILLRKHQINVLKEQCRKYQETLCLNKLNQEREHTCPGCGNLAWEPQVLICGHIVCLQCVSNERLSAMSSGRTRRCQKCRAFICRPPIPSITIRHAVGSIATKLGKVPPSPVPQ
ncbi:uncharacterized protein C8R40DRAFT_1069555 [Lentinula edodes]|uniref:uncharacterized protein n=1 Tax=Lentinula edodes TaxID=5353 RepID=UPI001E8E2300|nr:uncharacterized protein C8R40DRAFT_1069555 [Lentinula edodes]KAH7875039.1 hypothetical protein C8R40DRAFT_1069555 [Lentinula edodes]